MIGASFIPFRFSMPNVSGECCGSGSWPGYLIRFTVQPVNPELGFSFRVTDTGGSPLKHVGLPPLSHVTSGSPTVTAHIDGISLTAGVAGSGYVRTPDVNSFLVVVKPEDITGGTISAFSVVLGTPEPSTGVLFALGLDLVGWRLKRQNARRVLKGS